MATASLATLLQFDYLGNPKWALQGFELLEQEAFLPEDDSQMESRGNSFVEKNKLVGTLLNLYQPLSNSVQQQGYAVAGRCVDNNNTNQAANDFCMEYVDSPPDSKEAWPADYLKSDMQVSDKMVGIDSETRNVSGPNSPANMEMSKKRRMNWDEGDGSAAAGQQQQSQQGMVKDHLQIDRRKLARYSGTSAAAAGEDGVQQPGPVGPSGGGANNGAPGGGATAAGNAANSNANNNNNNSNPSNHHNGTNSGNGAGAWGDIDFDLNNDLSSNGYMNDALFYHSLGGFKQEVPSPTQDKNLILKQQQQQQNGNGANDMLGKRSHASIMAVEGNQNNNNNNNNGPSANMNVGSPDSVHNGEAATAAADILTCFQNQQQMCHLTSNGGQGGGGGGGAGNHLGNDTEVSFQQILQETNGYAEKMGNGPRVMSPDKPLSMAKYTNDDTRFQYVLAAATSIATKNNEDTLTYLNQGQSYEIKLKKLGDLTNYRNKILKSVIKICFYERRLQYMEREQMLQWQTARPGERILEIDVPLSFGCQPSQSANPNQLNMVEVMWDPMKEVGVYIKVNCISTEFTPKKHGGEKGVPFRIQIETFLDNKPVHGAMCQIKVFKLKGADRKHKQDREKIQKRPASEQEKFQPSYECTILNDIPRDLLMQQQQQLQQNLNTNSATAAAMSPSDHIPAIMHSPTTNGTGKFEAAGFAYTSNSNSNSSNSIGVLNRQGSASNPNLCKTLELIHSPPAALPAKDFYEMQNIQVTKDTSPQHLTQWINYHRLSSHLSTFAHFSGADLLRLTKDDLIQICGLADGIRMYNILHKKAITPRLTIFVSFDGGACFHAVYLYTNKLRELHGKTLNLPGFRQFYAKMQTKSEGQNNNGGVNGNGNGNFMWNGGDLQQGDDDFDMLVHLPSGIHVMITEDVISHMKDESSYLIVIENHRVILRPIVKD